MVVFFEQRVVFNCPLLELHVYTAAVDADDAPDATGRGGEMRRRITACAFQLSLQRVSRRRLSAEGKRNGSYSTLSVMRVLSFMVAVSANPLVAGDDMWDCSTVSKASRTSFSLT